MKALKKDFLELIQIWNRSGKYDETEFAGRFFVGNGDLDEFSAKHNLKTQDHGCYIDSLIEELFDCQIQHISDHKDFEKNYSSIGWRRFGDVEIIFNKNTKIKVKMTHKEAIEAIMLLIAEYTSPPHCPGTDHSWEIGINQDGQPDATCDALKDHYDATTLAAVFYDTTASGAISLEATDEMTKEEVLEFWIDEFMTKQPDGFEKLAFQE